MVLKQTLETGKGKDQEPRRLYLDHFPYDTEATHYTKATEREFPVALEHSLAALAFENRSLIHSFKE